MAAVFAVFLLATVALASAGIAECERDADVLILGAGISGLRAAESFHDAGTSFLILEQSDRIGGRIRSEEFGGGTVEHGAQWIINTDLDAPDDVINPLLALAVECGLQLRPEPLGVPGAVFYDSDGNDISMMPELGPELGQAIGRIRTAASLSSRNPIYEELQGTDEDLSLEAAFRLSNGWQARTPFERYVENFAVDLVYGYSSNNIGFRANTLLERSRTVFGDNISTAMVVTDRRGYVYLLECFSGRFLEENDTRLHLNTVVTRINWGDDCVCATVTEDGGEREYCGSYAVVTFSVGVLQSGIVQFEPQPPTEWMYTLHRARMANYLRAHFQFNETFWDTDVDFILYFDETQADRGFYNFIPQGAFQDGQPPILTALLSGDLAFRVASQDRETSRQEVSEIMRRIYGDRASEAIAVGLYEFIPSPYFRGNLGRPGVGFIERSYDILAGPLGRMYFAGDGTIGEQQSTAHGAYISGRNTAERILQAITDSAALRLEFINNTPTVAGDSIFAEFTVSRPVVLLQCRLSGQPRQNCQLTATTGAVNFTQVDTGSYRLTVIARNEDVDDRVVLRSATLTVGRR